MNEVMKQAELLFDNLNNNSYADLDHSPDTLTINQAHLNNYAPSYSGFVSFQAPEAGSDKEELQHDLSDNTIDYHTFNK